MDQRQTESLYIGKTVLWYTGADPSTTPHVCFVTKIHGNGRVDLIGWTASGGDALRHRNVRHISDPALKDNPVIAHREGAWDLTEPERIAA